MMGNRLRHLRESSRLTQEQLAERIEVGLQQINRWENGKTEPSGEMVARLAMALNTSADYLLGLTDDETPVELLKSGLKPQKRAAINAWRRGEKYEAIKAIVSDE